MMAEDFDTSLCSQDPIAVRIMMAHAPQAKSRHGTTEGIGCHTGHRLYLKTTTLKLQVFTPSISLFSAEVCTR